MPLDLTKLNQEQLVWYAKLLISVVLADEQIAASEVKFIKGILKHVEDQQLQKSLVNMLETRQIPTLEQPKGLDKFQLAEILAQLIEICISDLEFQKKEEELIRKAARVFDFHDMYTRELILWGQDGLAAKAAQQKLISKKINDEEFIVPVAKLDTEQKKWYIDVIVAALILEGIEEEREKDLLKKMILSTPSREEQVSLRNHVQMKHRPPLKRPPKMPEELLVMIFMEVIQIFTRLGDIGYHGSQLLKLLADLSRMSTKAYTDVMDWANRLILWKLKRKTLVANVRLNTSLEDQEAESKGLLVLHPQLNSIQVRKVKCFVCNSPAEFNYYQLKQNSQKPSQNIFQVPTYREANEGFQFVDFNLVKVTVCPTCYFSSTSRNQFHVSEKDKTPVEIANPKFHEQWVEGKQKREDQLGDRKNEILDIFRSEPTVLTTYDFAVEAGLALAQSSGSILWQWQVILLRLTQAEILLNAKRVDEAHNKMRTAMSEAERLFINSTDQSMGFRTGRFLLVANLYLKDEKNAMQYYDFFQRFKQEKLDFVSNEIKAEFNRYFTEAHQIWDRRESYAKAELDGFHLKKFKREGKGEAEEGTPNPG